MSNRDEYMKSIQEIFELAMQNGDLRIALQAKTLEARCRGMLDHKHKQINLENMPTELLQQMLEGMK